jgi:hypothetical protein
MTYLRQFVVSFACVAVIVAGAHVGAEPLPTNSNESTVLQRFEISKCGEIILLPVQIEDKTYPFFLDTGAARTVFDISLPIGKPSAVARVGTADKHIRASVFTTPRASVGKLSLDSVVPDILGLDLSDIRTVGCDLNGIIGADFLKHHVVQIDFDRGELIFLKNVEAIGTIGTPIDLSWDDSGCPTVSIRCGGQDVQRFIVDTGCVSFDSGGVNASFSRAMLKNGDARVVGSSRSTTLSGMTSSDLVQAKSLTLREFLVPNPIFGSARVNVLGLGYLSRFVITFDFAKSRMYLRPGESFNKVDLRDLSGLHILRSGKDIVVHSVDKDSVGQKAGIRSGDVILRIADTKADTSNIFQLRKLLCNEGSVPIVARRTNRQIEVSLDLK